MVNKHFLLATVSQGRLFPSKILSEKKHSSLASDGWTINSLASCTTRILRRIWRSFDHWSHSLTEHLYPICIQHNSSRKNSFSRKRVTGSVLLFRPRQQGIESTLFASAYEGSSTLSSANLLSCSFKVSPLICSVTELIIWACDERASSFRVYFINMTL